MVMGTGYNPRIVTENLVFCVDAANIRSYPKTGTTWSDLKGGNNGTLTNMDAANFSSDNGGGLVFDGANEFIEFNSAFTLSSLGISGSDPITLSCDFKITHLAQSMLLSFYNAPRCYIETFVQNSDLVVHWGFGSYNNSATSTCIIQQGYVYNFTTTYDGSTAKGYLNGTLKDTDNIGSISYNNNNLRIGKYTDGYSLLHEGTIYNCKIYDRALTADEIRQNYLATKERYA